MSKHIMQHTNNSPVKDYSEQQLQANYNGFLKELAMLSIQHGIVITCMGGLYLAKNQREHQSVVYANDISSGDLFVVSPDLWSDD